MSAIFRAELANLQRRKERHAIEAQLNTNERERVRTHKETRAARLHVVNRKLAKSNRQAIIDALRDFSRPAVPISANKVAEITGITDDTTRKHLRDLASEGIAVSVTSVSGKQTRYHLAKGK